MPRHFVIPMAIMLLLAATTKTPTAPAPKPSAERMRKEMDAAWADLLSADELTAARAVLRLAAAREDAVEYLKKKMRPLKLSKGHATRLIADLGGIEEKAARAAFEEFGYLDPRLALGDEELRDAMLDKPASRRLSAVLCDLPIDGMSGEKWHWYSPDNKVYRFNCGEAVSNRDVAISVALIGTVGRKATWARAIRAVAVLEYVDTPKARAILDEMATGHPDAAPTKAARLARGRLQK